MIKPSSIFSARWGRLCLAAIALTASAVSATDQPDQKPTEPAKPDAKKVKETYQVLSLHVTKAVFAGTSERRCRHRTALCPDRCSHGGTIARFDITRYIDYEKPGQYGDPKSEQFMTMLKLPDLTQKQIDQIKKLKKGTPVHLSWEHRYVKRTSPNGSSSQSPRRVIIELKPLPTP